MGDQDAPVVTDFDAALREGIGRVGVTVAIDGSAGSGKSTVSRRVASRVGIGYLDTGAMYRALTWFALESGVDLADYHAVTAAADQMPLRMDSDPQDPHFFMGEREITLDIRTPRISGVVSQVATNMEVRHWMAREQRRRMMEARANGHGMVAEGRDITTVVCPDADVRVLLSADPEARLRRRTLELYGRVDAEALEATRAQVQGRDAADSTVSEFMTPAAGVTPIDTSDLTIDQVVDQLVELIDRDVRSRLK